MKPFKWRCPYCNYDTTITENDVSMDSVSLNIENKNGSKIAVTKFIVYPNPECNEFSLDVSLHNTEYNSNYGYITKDLINKWNLLPTSIAKNFPDYIPKVIKDDYEEACLIKDLSPKASATLYRRCLQGMIRDFWGIKKNKLIDEIDVDPLTWKAIDSVRTVGNIGAHMEKDINMIIDIEPFEADLMIQLLETLMYDWYITRYERESRLRDIIKIKENKEIRKNGL